MRTSNFASINNGARPPPPPAELVDDEADFTPAVAKMKKREQLRKKMEAEAAVIALANRDWTGAAVDPEIDEPEDEDTEEGGAFLTPEQVKAMAAAKPRNTKKEKKEKKKEKKEKKEKYSASKRAAMRADWRAIDTQRKGPFALPPRGSPFQGSPFQGSPFQGSPFQGSPFQQQQQHKRDPVKPPSKASGGVPEPSAAYLAAAAQDPITLPLDQSQPLLVVIDLNGTLLFRPSQHKQPRRFVPRPHAVSFLRDCLRHFTVLIWSSARPLNVAIMWQELLNMGLHLEQQQQQQLQALSGSISEPPLPPPIAVWGRDRFGLDETDYNSRVQVYKRLSTVWDNVIVAASYPGLPNTTGTEQPPTPPGWSQFNTVLIDDSLEKARSEPHNLIQIPEYSGGTEEPFILPLVREYLMNLRFQQNVSAYMRVNPFRVPSQ